MIKFRVGIIGCGARAPFHIRGWQRVENAEIIAVADLLQERRDRVGDAFDIPQRYDSYETLLQEAQVDCISVATKPALREPVIQAAVANGVRGVLCEKPVARSLQEMERSLYICNSQGVVLVANHQLRHLADWQRLAVACAREELGQIERIEVTSYGNLLAQGTHLLDILLQFAGDQHPEWVLAQTSGWIEEAGHPAPALSLAHFRFHNNLSAYAVMGAQAPTLSAEPPGYFDFQLRIAGTEGHGQVSLAEGARIWRKGHTGWESWPERWVNDSDLEQAQYGLCESLVRALTKPGYQPPANGRCMRLSLEMIEAICESARTHSVVCWPLPAWESSPLQALRPEPAHV